MLTFEEYCQIIEQWQKEGYPFVPDDALRLETAVFDKKLNDLADKGDEKAMKQRDYIEGLLAKPINVTNFCLEEYLKSNLSRFDFSHKIINLFAQQIQEEKAEFEAPIERLGNYALIENSVALDDDDKLKNRIQEILDKILSVNKGPNKILKESLAKHSVIFQFTRGKLNASMNVCIIKHNLRPVLRMRIPDFDALQNADIIAGILGHEFGHWLDFSNRPQNCVVENGLMQECFADIVGCQIAKNAGYNIEPFTDRVKGFIAYFDEHKLSQYKICSQKRLELMTKIFGQAKIHNIELSKDGRD